MTFRKLLVAAPAALALTATPVLAQADTAADADRATESYEEGEYFFGLSFLVTALVAAAAVVATVVIVDEITGPSSP